MARVVELKPIKKSEPIPRGMMTLLTFIHQRMDAAKGKTYPEIVEISKGAEPFKIDSSWNFEVPITELMKKY